jgi:hypothetical protein
MRHYPQNPAYWFRADGRAPDWQEYILSNANLPQTFTHWESEHGLCRGNLTPASKTIQVSGSRGELPPTQRVSFTRVCPHWRNSVMGQRAEYLLLLRVPGRKNKGPFQDLLTVETDGYNFWVDVPRHELGAPGEEVMLQCLDKIEGVDARGTTKDDWERNVKNKKAISSQGMAVWKLV